jgi:rhodanese-related sulfurtransferase
MASVLAANMLEEAGYTNVVHHRDGLAGGEMRVINLREKRRSK